MGVLPGFSSVVVHDGWGPYEALDGLTHAQCLVHMVRHLRAVGETPEFSIWTAQMHQVPTDANKAVSETAATAGLRSVARRETNAIVRRYHDALDLTFTLLPPGGRRRGVVTYGRLEQRTARRVEPRHPDAYPSTTCAPPPPRHRRPRRQQSRRMGPSDGEASRQGAGLLSKWRRRTGLRHRSLLPADRRPPEPEPARRARPTLRRRALASPGRHWVDVGRRGSNAIRQLCRGHPEEAQRSTRSPSPRAELSQTSPEEVANILASSSGLDVEPSSSPHASGSSTTTSIASSPPCSRASVRSKPPQINSLRP